MGAVRVHPSPSQEGTGDRDGDGGSPPGAPSAPHLCEPCFFRPGYRSSGVGPGRGVDAPGEGRLPCPERPHRLRASGEREGSSQPTGSHTCPEPAARLNTSASSSWSQTAWVQILSPIYQLCHPEQVTSPLYISVSAKVNGDDDKRAYIKGPGEDRMREPMEDR